MKTYIKTFTAFAILLMPMVTEGFITQRNCPASSPCVCYSYFISCARRHLTSIPAFGTSYWTQDKLTLSIIGNELTTIQSYAFRGLRFRYRTKVDLLLNMNHLSSIENNSFSGIADKVVYINLDDNNFTSLPIELSVLTQLQELTILRNPIMSLDDATMSSLGTNLRSFQIGLQDFKIWPTEMLHLTKLEELSLSNVYFQDLDPDVFGGMNSLTKVKIDNSSLVSIPVALTKFPLLNSFTISRSNKLSFEESQLKPCIFDSFNSTNKMKFDGSDQLINNNSAVNCVMTSSMNVEISHNNLRYLDRIFTIFPFVTNLSLSYNNISFIYSDDIRENMTLVDLDISHNNLTRIPTALNKISALLSLDLQYNRIVSVEDFDIFRLTDLQMIMISHNPLEYISSNAFENNKQLKVISLSDTRLRFLPLSLSRLTGLQELSLPYGVVECNCKMAPLKSWDVSRITLSGYCKDKNVSIKHFIENDLPECR